VLQTLLHIPIPVRLVPGTIPELQLCPPEPNTPRSELGRSFAHPSNYAVCFHYKRTININFFRAISTLILIHPSGAGVRLLSIPVFNVGVGFASDFCGGSAGSGLIHSLYRTQLMDNVICTLHAIQSRSRDRKVSCERVDKL
jgi:hypothetical protein